MVSSFTSESPTVRGETYIDELRDFFRTRQLGFGHPEDLQPFADQLGDPAFYEEMVSMLRSILYREDGLLPSRELMELLAVAVAGAPLDDAGEDLHRPLRQLHGFVGTVFRSQKQSFPPELEDVQVSSEIEAETAHVTPVNGTAAAAPGTPVQGDDHASAEFPPTLAPREQPATSLTQRKEINDRLSRALGTVHGQQTALPDELPAALPVQPQPSRPQPTPAPSLAPARRPQRSFPALLREAYWIPGLCLLLIAIVLGWWLTRTSRSQPELGSAPIAMSRPTPSTASAPSTITSRIARQPSAPLSSGNPVPPRTPRALNAPLAESSSHRSSYAPSPVPVPSRASRASGAPWIVPRTPVGNPNSREGVFLASSGAMAAHLLSAPAPGYPKLARLTHVEGQVIVQVVVARDGTVATTHALEGPRLLRSAAEHAIRHWRYRPYLVEGKPTDVATIVTVTFRLRP